MYLLLDTKFGFTNHAAHTLYRIQVTASSAMTLTNMRNVVPRAGFEPTLLSNLGLVGQPLHYLGSRV